MEYNFDHVVTENITLTAKWEINTYTITFDSNGYIVVGNQYIEHGSKVHNPHLTREGYTLLGWYYNGVLYDFNTPVTGDMLLTAQWKKNTENSEDPVVNPEPEIPENQSEVSSVSANNNGVVITIVVISSIAVLSLMAVMVYYLRRKHK